MTPTRIEIIDRHPVVPAGMRKEQPVQDQTSEHLQRRAFLLRLTSVLAAAMAAGEALADTPSPGRDPAIRFGPIFFAADTSALSEDAKAELDKAVAWLKTNPDRKVRLEGHTDDSGTNEYSLALGDKLANVAKAHLVAGGVDAARIKAVSYGRFRPLPGAGGKNARVELVLDQ